MSKKKNNKTKGTWEFFDKYGNLCMLGNWYNRYKITRTTDIKHKKKYINEANDGTIQEG